MPRAFAPVVSADMALARLKLVTVSNELPRNTSFIESADNKLPNDSPGSAIQMRFSDSDDLP